MELNVDGTGVSEIETGIPFFDHMLTLFAKHGLFDLKVNASGDTPMDAEGNIEIYTSDINVDFGGPGKYQLPLRISIVDPNADDTGGSGGDPGSSTEDDTGASGTDTGATDSDG